MKNDNRAEIKNFFNNKDAEVQLLDRKIFRLLSFTCYNK